MGFGSNEVKVIYSVAEMSYDNALDTAHALAKEAHGKMIICWSFMETEERGGVNRQRRRSSRSKGILKLGFGLGEI